MYKILCEKFAAETDSLDLTLPFLFSIIDPDKEADKKSTYTAKMFKPYLTARIEIKMFSKDGTSDFQIFSVSDDKAEVLKPAWFQKDGIGYIITSLNGELEFSIRSTTSKKIRLYLKGMDIRDKADKSKRIPYWIDYTKLSVNDKIIFDEIIPTWHDKPYRHDMDVKTGEEVKIRVEWTPHRSNT